MATYGIPRFGAGPGLSPALQPSKQQHAQSPAQAAAAPHAQLWSPTLAIPPSLVSTSSGAMARFARHTVRALAWMRAHPAPTRAMPAWDSPDVTGVAVLVEPRNHANLAFTLHNTAHFLGACGWVLLVVHGTANEASVRALTAGWTGVRLHSLGKANITEKEYNHMLTTREFWHLFAPHKHAAIVQTDMLWMAGVPAGSPYLGYDLVGAPWASTCFVCRTPIRAGVPCCGAKVDDQALHSLAPQLVGNGGAALRRVDAMLAVCTRFAMANDALVAPDDPRERIPGTSSEDVFFACGLNRIGGRICPRAAALAFGIEQTLPVELPADTPWAVCSHKAYAYHNEATVDAMLGAYTMRDEVTGDTFRDHGLGS